MPEFRDIPGYPNYKVTSDGRVWSDYTQNFMSLQISNKGYAIVQLRNGGRRRKSFIVHRLVAEAFIGPCPEGQQVRHGPAGKLDNSASNLSYGTQSENNNDKLRDGTTAKGEKHSQARLTEADVLAIRESNRTQKELAAEYGMSVRMIGKIKRREKWTHLP